MDPAAAGEQRAHGVHRAEPDQDRAGDPADRAGGDHGGDRRSHVRSLCGGGRNLRADLRRRGMGRRSDGLRPDHQQRAGGRGRDHDRVGRGKQRQRDDHGRGADRAGPDHGGPGRSDLRGLRGRQRDDHPDLYDRVERGSGAVRPDRAQHAGGRGPDCDRVRERGARDHHGRGSGQAGGDGVEPVRPRQRLRKGGAVQREPRLQDRRGLYRDRLRDRAGRHAGDDRAGRERQVQRAGGRVYPGDRRQQRHDLHLPRVDRLGQRLQRQLPGLHGGHGGPDRDHERAVPLRAVQGRDRAG